VGIEEGGCDAVSGRGRDTGAMHVRASGGTGSCAIDCPRKKKLGGAHVAVRGEGGGGLGRPKAKARWGGRWLGLGEGGGP
jgi:hypothetical protein